MNNLSFPLRTTKLVTAVNLVEDQVGVPVCHTNNPDFARHIVACLNACAGASTEQLEAVGDEGLVQIPRKPSEAMLRPFYDCPPDELGLAYETMLVMVASA
jgi:hypothetical protein